MAPNFSKSVVIKIINYHPFNLKISNLKSKKIIMNFFQCFNSGIVLLDLEKIRHDPILYSAMKVSLLLTFRIIEKPLEIPYWNSLCLRRICLFVYVCSVSKNKITKPYAKKYDRLLVNDDKIVS